MPSRRGAHPVVFTRGDSFTYPCVDVNGLRVGFWREGSGWFSFMPIDKKRGARRKTREELEILARTTYRRLTTMDKR